jgi:hypothetical protein
MADTLTLRDIAKKLLTMTFGTKAVVETEEERVNKKINAQVLADAERNRAQIIKQSENLYSKDLQTIGQRLSRSSQITAENQTIVVVDPVKIVVGQALGMSGGQALKDQLPDHIVNELEKKYSAPVVTSSLNLITMDGTVRSNPANISGVGRLCVATPVSERSPMQIEGLTEKEQEDLLNNHEAWHCLDDRSILELAIKDMHTPVLGAENLQKSRDQYIIEEQKTEAFADLGSLGNMIKDGYPLSIIDKAIAWRDRRPHDISHYTGKTLEVLKANITEMGVEKFKSLDIQELKDLYHTLTEKHALTSSDIRNLEVSVKPVTKDTSLLPDTPVVQQTLKDWNYRSEIQKKAIALGGEVSPTTLLRAYAQRQDDFRQEIQANPESESMVTAKMFYLADKIKDIVQTTDYVRANQENGVDLKAAPSFSKFMKPPEEAAKPDTALHAPRIAAHTKPAHPSI